jgi:UDP-N-acetylglucosamine 2-epimerase (non-hydrolysing)
LELNDEYALLTLHRPSNVDDKVTFTTIIEALEEIADDLDIVFPIHPRTRKMAISFDLFDRLENISGMRITEPIGYLDFVSLISRSKLVLTDSGGLQEETTALGIPCLTLRENTERPITVTEGTNTIVGTDKDLIISLSKEVVKNGGKSGRIPELWDGNTAGRIVDVLLKYIES